MVVHPYLVVLGPSTISFLYRCASAVPAPLHGHPLAEGGGAGLEGQDSHEGGLQEPLPVCPQRAHSHQGIASLLRTQKGAPTPLGSVADLETNYFA